MTLVYADPSALIRAYFPDEPEHEEIHVMLLGGTVQVVTSELSRLEHASAVRAAAQAGRLVDPERYLRRFALDSRDEGRIRLIALRADPILSLAYDLVTAHRLRTLDAIHLAVAIEDGRSLAGRDGLTFVTRDDDQATAARALGLSVR